MAYSNENNPNNPDAKPLYNDNFFKFWNWFDTVWNCNDWITWHKSMENKYGRSTANATFLYYWDDLATGSSAIDCRTLNQSFRDYAKKVGIFDYLYKGVGIIAKPIGSIISIGSSIGGTIGNVAKGLERTSKTLKDILPIILIIVVGFLIFKYYKKFNK